jgi:hypothetical protein
LGDWADECEGDPIVSFVSTGPKSYAYRTRSGKTCIKVKGFSLQSPTTTEQLNQEVMQQMVQEEELYLQGSRAMQQSVSITYERHIKRDATTHQMTSVTQTKKFRLTFDKRLILPEHNGTIDTVPYGYAHMSEQSEVGGVLA